MKFEVKIRTGSQVTEHTVEIPARQAAAMAEGRVQFVIDGSPGEANWAEVEPGVYSLIEGGRSTVISLCRGAGAPMNSIRYQAFCGGPLLELELRDSRARRRSGSGWHQGGSLEILAPMPGRIVKVLAGEGATVSPGDELLVMEAMKMQNVIRASRGGRVGKVHVREGEGVESGAPLMSLV